MTETATFTCANDNTHVETVEATVISKTTDATCTEAGKIVYTATVEFAGQTYTDTKETAIPATGHNYGEPEFTWSKDYSTATATFTCANDNSHVENVEATVTSKTTNATCTEAGKIVYTATAEFEGQTYTDTKEVAIKAIGHNYAAPVFTWSEDYSTAKAAFTCKNDKTHILEKDCEVTAETEDATCTTAGKVTYTASVTVAGETYTDTKVVDGTALGHNYGEPEFTWSKDKSTATATFTCANDNSHVETVEAAVTSKTTDATCIENGKIVYTATVKFAGQTYTDSKEVAIKAIGHNYAAPVFTWSEDYSTAKAAFTCKNDKTHILEKDCEVTAETEDATCTENGKIVYTATAKFAGQTYTDSKEVAIPATGHDYAVPVFTWSKDYSTAKAAFTCKNDKTHVLEKDCEVTAETEDATCTTAGKVTYTASVTVAGETYTDTKVVDGTALGHKYGEPEFTWSKDKSTATATFTCVNDNSHVETVEAAVTSKTTDATCTEAGKIVYTATAKFAGQTYTDSKEVAIPATGHDYAVPVFTWSKDYSTAKAAFTCKNDKTHVLEKDCEVTAETEDATCTTAGKVTYTASVTVAGETYTDTKVVDGTALGHKYGEPEFTWSKDKSAATATFICANDNSHVETVEATVTSETTDATCTEDGKIVYTATAEFAGQTYTDVKEVAIPAAGHSWSDWKEIQSPTADANGKKESTCTVCGLKKYENIPATGTPAEEDPSNGNLEKDVQIVPGAPIEEATMTNTKAELLDAANIFSEKEKDQIKKGTADAKVWMEIHETDLTKIPDATKDAVYKQAEEIMGDQASELMYFDADLFKEVTSESDGTTVTDKTQIHDPGEHIAVTVKIPEKLLLDPKVRSMVREYRIIRIHTDQTTNKDSIDVLDGSFNENSKEFSFKTDKFSTYAIAFSDVPLQVSIEDDGSTKELTKKGETLKLTASVTPDGAADRTVTWTSSDPAVAVVDENGVVTAVADGTTVITATVADGGAAAEITVKVNIKKDETPTEPEKPTNPETPTKPDTPAKPETPTKPETPAKPETPVTPVTPAAPTVSGSVNPVAQTKSDVSANSSQTPAPKTDSKKSVQTGDDNRTWLWIMMMFAGAGIVIFTKKKQKNG